MNPWTIVVTGLYAFFALYTAWLVAKAVRTEVARRNAQRTLAARKAERWLLLAYIADTDPAAFRGTFDALVADITASDYRPEGEAWDEHVAGALALTEPTPIHDELAVERMRAWVDAWNEGSAR